MVPTLVNLFLTQLGDGVNTSRSNKAYIHQCQLRKLPSPSQPTFYPRPRTPSCLHAPSRPIPTPTRPYLKQLDLVLLLVQSETSSPPSQLQVPQHKFDRTTPIINN